MMKQIDKQQYPRHLARRAVLQAMYIHLANDENDTQKLFQYVIELDENIPAVVHNFIEELLESAIDRGKIADSVIDKVTENWELERISMIDRSILRIGIAEFLDFPNISPKVTIDEAVELAKEFGSADSPKFVNGVLDAALKEIRDMKLLAKEE
ncbi:transcription antitermination factor NusB [bacterium]|nr:MAG: transcription antitermination factor NusB [bacterium]